MSTTGEAIARALGSAADAEATPLSTLITGPDPAREFATLVQRLVIHQARRNDFTDRLRVDVHSGACRIEDGFPGCKGTTLVAPCWTKTIESIGDNANNRMLDQALYALFPHTDPPDNFCPVLPILLPRPLPELLLSWLSLYPQHTKMLDSAEVMKWLRDCPPLLARYFPQEAAKLTGNHGFQGQSLAALARQYTHSVREHPDHANLQFLGIPPGVVWAHPNQSQQAPKLKDIFVPLSFGKWTQSGAEAQTEVALDALISQPAPRVILGDPGSGKTTILHYLALRNGGGLESSQTPSPAVAPGPMPLFLALPDFVRFEKERPGQTTDFVDYWLHQAQSLFALSTAHRWLFESALEMGEAVVMLDSLDEVGQLAARARIARLIECFHQRSPQCPVWVTSRIVGYEGPDCSNARLNEDLFSHYVIQKLSPDQQRLFIEQWFGRQWAHDSRQAQAKASALLKARQSTPGVARLASNPLLLTLMAFIHGKRGLPRYRGEVYEKCVECLLESWPEARGSGSLSGQASLADLDPPIQPRRYLSALALHTQEANAAEQTEATSETDGTSAAPEDDERRNRIPEPFLRECLEQLRLGDFGVDEKHPATQAQREQAKKEVTLFLNYIRFRTGLLLYRGGDGDAGEFRFAHLTFLEYLAAVQLADTLSGDALTDFFLNHVEDTAWTEVLLLLLFRVSEKTSARPVFQRLVNAALEAGRSSGFWQTMGLAVRDELPFLDRDATDILRYLIIEWCRLAAFSGEPFKTLQDIAEFSPRKHPLLLSVLAEHWRQEQGGHALIALHLRVRLLGWPHADAAESGRLATELVARLNTTNELAAARSLFDRAGLLLATANPTQFPENSPGDKAVKWVRHRLQDFITEPQLSILEREVSAQALGWLGDPRPGVGLHHDGPLKDLPAMEWLDLPGGEFELGECPGKKVKVEPFQISKYPVTVEQFRAFLDDPTGYHEPQWWKDGKDAPGMTAWWKENHEQGPEAYDPVFQTPNHPRVGVNWYEAVAFCRWLTERLRSRRRESAPSEASQRGLTSAATDEVVIRLSHEAEWEWAARWNGSLDAPQSDDRYHPWRDSKKGDSEPSLNERCNCSQTSIGSTSAVGLFPNGASECGALDLSGNVWEWCSNEYEEGSGTRVVRGGSWGGVNPGNLSCSYRRHDLPTNRNQGRGFRCVVVGGVSAAG